jgi:hypothetical protein
LVFVTTIGTPIDPRNFTRLFHQMCESPGVPAVRLHDLRHTCVSLLLALGVHPRVVMEIVGHAALEMTMNVYGHVVLDAQREALSELARRPDGDGACAQGSGSAPRGSVSAGVGSWRAASTPGPPRCPRATWGQHVGGGAGDRPSSAVGGTPARGAA